MSLLLLTMAASPVASLSPFVAEVKRTTCQTSGGTFGYGYTAMKVRMEENGRTGTNYFRYIFRLQRWTGSRWVVVSRQTITSARIPDDSTSHYLAQTYGYAFGSGDASHYNRLSVRLEWWDARTGPDRLLASALRAGPNC